MFEKKKIDVTPENVLILTKFNPDMAMNFAEAMLKADIEAKIVEIFKIAPRDTLIFIYKHPDLASLLADLIPEKIDEIINMDELPNEQLIKLALSFDGKMLDIAKKNPKNIAEIFYEAMNSIDKKYKGQKNEDEAIKFIQKKISEIGEEFPDYILQIAKQINKFSKCNHGAEKIIINTAKFFPEKAAEIALEFKLEKEIAKEVPSVAAKIAIEKPELAFEIMEMVPESEQVIRDHFTLNLK